LEQTYDARVKFFCQDSASVNADNYDGESASIKV